MFPEMHSLLSGNCCKFQKGLFLIYEMCYTFCTEQSCCRVADLYSYIEWGWCWWTKNRLILKTWWLLVCSFLHCWHSFLRFWSNAIYIENHPHNFDRFRVAFLCSLYRSTPCGRLLLFYYQYSISGSRIQELLQHKVYIWNYWNLQDSANAGHSKGSWVQGRERALL